jgi:hypothetical protein
MVIQDIGSSLVVLLELAGCMIHFKHRLPTSEEVNSLKQYWLTQCDTPRNHHHFLIKLLTSFINRSLIINSSLIMIKTTF